MFQDPHTNKLRRDAGSKPVYVIFKRLPGNEGKVRLGRQSNRLYSPKVVWCKTFDQLQHWIEGYKVLKHQYDLIGSVNVNHAAEANAIEWEENEESQVAGDTNSSELKCVLVFYRRKIF